MTLQPKLNNMDVAPSLSQKTYEAMYQASCQNPERFWNEMANIISWQTPWKTVYVGDFAKGENHWFEGGKLNASFNCLDRHLGESDKIAIYWEGDTPEISRKITYRALYQEVCRFSNALKDLGVKKGDTVCIYLPMIPEIVVAMLACARIGAIHSVVFAGFSAESLSVRIKDASCCTIITADENVRGGKIVPLKAHVDAAIASCDFVKNVITVKRTGGNIAWDLRCHWYHDLIVKAKDTCAPEDMDANDPLFILYTSGSTGKPKGILHATGGYMVYAATTFRYIFDYRPIDVYWCTADCGWITGHTYMVYGPLSLGATMVIYEGVPQYPTYARYWEIVDKYGVSIFYTSPTAIRALRKEGDAYLNTSSRHSLRLLGTVGEPINPEVWEWYFSTVGHENCPIVDTWWQTETGGILISPLPGATPLKPGAASWPFFGIVPAIVDESGQPINGTTNGQLVITRPWPGMMQTIYNDKQRFIDTYFKKVPGCYLTGDSAHRDEAGYYFIAGRDDDVMKVSGHRIGTEEVESALLKHHAVSEAAVVGIANEIKGQGIYAFITLNGDITPSDALKAELIETVRREIGPIATPEKIQWAAGLPKTRSGKIMRRLLRKIANNDTENLGDLSTLVDPGVIQTLIAERN